MIENIFKKNVKNNEDYKEVLKAKRVVWLIMLLLGILTIGVGLMSNMWALPNIDDYMKGLYLGFGVGLSVVCSLKLLKIGKVLKNENLLKKERLKNYDERNISIYQKAIVSASFMSMLICYAVALVAGLFNTFITQMIFACVGVYLMIFLAFYFYYQKRM